MEHCLRNYERGQARQPRSSGYRLASHLSVFGDLRQTIYCLGLVLTTSTGDTEVLPLCIGTCKRQKAVPVLSEHRHTSLPRLVLKWDLGRGIHHDVFAMV